MSRWGVGPLERLLRTPRTWQLRAGLLAVALALGGAAWLSARWYDRRQRAAEHALSELEYLRRATWAEDAAAFYAGQDPEAPRWLEQAAGYRERAARHGRLKRLYEWAAVRPWQPLRLPGHAPPRPVEESSERRGSEQAGGQASGQ